MFLGDSRALCKSFWKPGEDFARASEVAERTLQELLKSRRGLCKSFWSRGEDFARASESPERTLQELLRFGKILWELIHRFLKTFKSQTSDFVNLENIAENIISLVLDAKVTILIETCAKLKLLHRVQELYSSQGEPGIERLKFERWKLQFVCFAFFEFFEIFHAPFRTFSLAPLFFSFENSSNYVFGVKKY